MKYDLTKKENGIFEALVTVESNEWNDAINHAYEKNKGKYNIPGFRKGHAPRAVIEKTYGEGAFFNDALDEVYYLAYTLVLREHEEVKPIDAPKLELKKIDSTGVEMVLTLTCMPDFKLAQYKGLKFTKPEVKVDEAQVEEEIRRDLLRGSKLVETKEPAKKDDFVTLDFEGFVDGKPFDGGKAANYQLQLFLSPLMQQLPEQMKFALLLIPHNLVQKLHPNSNSFQFFPLFVQQFHQGNCSVMTKFHCPLACSHLLNLHSLQQVLR